MSADERDVTVSATATTFSTRRALPAVLAAASGLFGTVAALLMPVVASGPVGVALGGFNHCETDLTQ